MHRLSILFLLLVLPVFAQAQAFPNVASTPKRVTVYRQGAVVTRCGELTLGAGANDLRFEGLEQGVDPATVQLAIDPTVAVLTLSSFDEPGGEGVEPDSVVELRGQLDSLQVDTALLGAERSGYTAELQLLLVNRDFPDELQVADYSEAVQRAASYYRARTQAIRTKLVRIDRRAQKLGRELAVLQKRIDAARPAERTRVGRVQTRLLAERAGTFDFELSYLVTDASWNPEYDLFVDPEAAEAAGQLVLVGNVTQATGVDWDGVDLTLSTGDPNRKLTAPELSPAYVGGAAPGRPALEQRKMAAEIAADYNVTFVSETSQLTTRSYAIEQRFDLPADGQSYAVRLSRYPLDLQLRHRVVPKLEAKAYLEGLATGWDTLNLIPGEVRLHLEGRYLGTQYLNPLAQTSDTLSFALGADDAVLVGRRTTADVMDTQVLRGRQSYARAYVRDYRAEHPVASHRAISRRPAPGGAPRRDRHRRGAAYGGQARCRDREIELGVKPGSGG